MLSEDEVNGQEQLLAAHRRTLTIYLQQQAEIGRAYSPPSLINGITETRANIRRIKQLLRDAGITIADSPDDSEAPDEPVMQPRTTVEPVVHERPPRQNRRRWLIGGVLVVGIFGAVALLVLQFMTSDGAGTQAPLFSYSFAGGTSNWNVDNVDADKWIVSTDEPGSFVYQGTAPNDHNIASAPPSNDIIGEWPGYAAETMVRVVQPSPNFYAFEMLMRGEDNTPSGCAGYQFLISTNKAYAQIGLTGTSDQCPFKVLAQGPILIGGDQWFKVRTEAIGTQLRLYINDTVVLQADDKTLPKGYFYVSIEPGAIVQFRDIRIWEITE